ncbi:MAG: class A beta-lactamase-related serine hydrolase [Candidatus Eremiobacteraeota bacterium]|nr:class A beta-lactamase-related serine hydrolase [Candidatus Eremiobacteraeota bacterium]
MDRRSFLFTTGALLFTPARARGSGFQDRLERIIAGVPGSIGIYARLMNDAPPLYSHAANESFPAASTIKLLIMLAAFDRQDRNPETLRERVTVHRSDLVAGSPFLLNARGGETYTVEALLKPMIQLSDNSASNALISHFGFEAINAAAGRYGLRDTRLKRHFLDYAAVVNHHENVTTPSDMGRLLFGIERGSREGLQTCASARSCRAMIGIMLGQEDRGKIAAGIPASVAIANKTGEVNGVRNDISIVDPFGDTPFVLTVLTKNLRNHAAGVLAIKRIARQIYAQVAAGDRNL